MPRGRRTKRTTNQSSSDDDDDVIGNMRRASPVKEKVLTAARNSFLRRTGSKVDMSAGDADVLAAAAAVSAKSPRSARADRRQRRKSRRKNKHARGNSISGAVEVEAKEVEEIQVSELNARQKRRSQRRKRRNTPQYANNNAFGAGDDVFGAINDADNLKSAYAGADDVTEVENIAWQHQLSKQDRSDSDVSDDGGRMDFSDEERNRKRQPRNNMPQGTMKGSAWGSRQKVPADSDSTAGIKGGARGARPTSAKRQLSPVNMRRRAEQKALLKKQQQQKRGGDSDSSDDEQRPRSRRARGRSARSARSARGGRGNTSTRGRRGAQRESESESESSEDDAEEITGRRRGRRAAAAQKQKAKKKERKIMDSDSDEPSTPKSPSHKKLSPRSLHRTNHEAELAQKHGTPRGHSALKRGSPHSGAVHEQLKDQLEASGLRKSSAPPEGKGTKGTHKRSNSQSSVSSLSSGGSDESGHPAILDGIGNDIDPAPSLKRVQGSPHLIGFASGSDSAGEVADAVGFGDREVIQSLSRHGSKRSLRSLRQHDHKNDDGSYGSRSPSPSSSGGEDNGHRGTDFTSKPRHGVAAEETTPGDKGREVFKGALSASPRKSPRAGMSGERDFSNYSEAATSNWMQKRRFLTTPIPVEAGILQCKVVRNKKKDTFVLWLENTRPSKGDSVEFLLVGKQRKGAKATLNYVISMDETDHSRHGKGCVGKLRANMQTTEYILYDEGLNPGVASNHKMASSPSNKSNLREELCLIDFVKGAMGIARGPRHITAFMPYVDKKSLSTFRCRPHKESSGLRSWARHHGNSPSHKTYMLINKPPVWNEQVRKYILNFNGRVEVASVKNFQLVLDSEREDLVLQCGRSHDGADGSSSFILDFGWPLSPLQAFAIGLAGMTA